MTPYLLCDAAERDCLPRFTIFIKVTVQFERCFRLMEHISVIS